MMARIRVQRWDPERGGQPALVTYEVPMEEGATVLGALLHVYEANDSSLALRFACRNVACGLCAVDVDGRPRLACTTPLKDGMTIRPLRRLPVARDLSVERDWILPLLERLALYPPAAPSASEWPAAFAVPKEHTQLSSCIECLICLASCPSYEHGRDDLGGPYHFVKLAQMHWEPRNMIDRRAQAAGLAIGRCSECRRCRCPLGVPIQKAAIAPLMAR
jgi:succinate dehydrogenase/fumarate reductase iron-sulfur protein